MDKAKVVKTNDSSMKVESIAECSKCFSPTLRECCFYSQVDRIITVFSMANDMPTSFMLLHDFRS